MLRNKVMKIFAAALGIITFSTLVAFSSPGSGTSLSSDDALQKLMDGNKRYIENKPTNAAVSGAATRTSLANSQKPYAIILLLFRFPGSTGDYF